jgi:SAM-dependent methyltransferase
VELARNSKETWMDDLAAYWNRFGSEIGEVAVPLVAPSTAGDVQVRAVRFLPGTVLSITPRDLNIVLQRVEMPSDQGFDLIVATNVLVYYDVFEQALALANIGRMLRPGGLFLTNTTVLSSPTMTVVGYTDTPYTNAGDGDRIWWYRRR